MLPCEIYINIFKYIDKYDDMYNFILSCQYKKELLNYLKYNDIRKYYNLHDYINILCFYNKNKINIFDCMLTYATNNNNDIVYKCTCNRYIVLNEYYNYYYMNDGSLIAFNIMETTWKMTCVYIIYIFYLLYVFTICVKYYFTGLITLAELRIN
jgi:hypothetical protein